MWLTVWVIFYSINSRLFTVNIYWLCCYQILHISNYSLRPLQVNLTPASKLVSIHYKQSF